MQRLCLIAIFALGLAACAQPTPQPTIIIVPTATVVLPAPTPAPIGQVDFQGSADETKLKTLLGRIMDQRLSASPLSGPRGFGAPRLWVNALPSDMPFALALPEATTLIGASQDLGPLPNYATIYWTSPQPPEQVLAETLAQLEAQGIERWELRGAPSVFVTATAYVLFCNKSLPLQGDVWAYPIEDGLTEGRLSYFFGDLVTCDDPVPDMTTYAQSILPTLKLPEVVIREAGTSQGGNIEGLAYQAVEFYSPQTLEELHQHFALQLEDQAWELLDSAPNGPMAWSRWQITDEFKQRWVGLLTVLAGPAGGEARMVSFQVELAR